MTNQEAIETIKTAIAEVEWNYPLEYAVAFEKAIEALGKQIPKKLIKKNPICYDRRKDGNELYAYDYHCPNCDAKVNKEKHHCPCGQALDWSDEE